MIRLYHHVTCGLLILAILLVVTPAGAANRVEESDLQRIERQIQLARNQLSQIATELRDAKLLAAEKMMEYEAVRDNYQLQPDTVGANSLDHAQQRLALAEMGVESKAARYERVQKKLSELAEAKQEILAEPPSPPSLSQAAVTDKATRDGKNTSNTSVAATRQTPVKSPEATPNSHVQLASSATTNPQLAPIPLVQKILQPAFSDRPVLTHHGKLSDIYQLNAELQKLEHHLTQQRTVPTATVQAKVYGTAISGEIALAEMGGNQFFARFPAPAGTASLIIGARHPDGYIRTSMQITFSPEEAGKEFFLIFDLNTRDQPRALVFQESLAFTREMFAAHGDF